MKNLQSVRCDILYPSKKEHLRKIRVLQKRSDVFVLNDLGSQLEEIYNIRHPNTIIDGKDARKVRQFIAAIYKESQGEQFFGSWVWYPWNKYLVRFLPEHMHTELRTSRNRNLITEKEQTRYYHARVGVAGLSVGNSVVSNIVHTGGAKYMKIADGDTVAGSNTNRIRVGFDAIGLPKTTIAAREIYLINPYAEVEVYDHGITKDSLEKFLLYPKPLDAVVDEMDNLYLKIQLRIMARKHHIPVVMAADNGDGVVVDIERFDLDSTLPLMHGDVRESELMTIRPDTSRIVAARIISSWVKPENIAERMIDSLMELGKTLYTWPQIGNAASMAGSIMAYVVRRIVVGLPISGGKFVISPDAIFVPEYKTEVSKRKRSARIAEYIKASGLS